MGEMGRREDRKIGKNMHRKRKREIGAGGEKRIEVHEHARRRRKDVAWRENIVAAAERDPRRPNWPPAINCI